MPEQSMIWSEVQRFLGLSWCWDSQPAHWEGKRWWPRASKASHLLHVAQQNQDLDPGL